jgi:acyl CoA:acetate/3-ketoacid CoA transferase
VQGAELITFNRDAAAKKGQEAVYLTGRAALPRERDSRMLMEVAAGVDVRKGVLTLIHNLRLNSRARLGLLHP